MKPLHAYWNRDGRELWEVTDKDAQVVATLDRHHQKAALLLAQALAINADLLAVVRRTQDYLDKRWDDANALDDAICAAIAKAEEKMT